MTTLLLGMAIRGSVVLAAGLLLTACLARRSAALRHRVLATSLAATALVAPMTVIVPEWRVPVPERFVAPAPAPLVAVHIAARSAPVTPTPAPPVRPRVSAIVAIWLGGVAVFVGSLAGGLLRVHRLVARGSTVDDPEWLALRDALAADQGVARPVVLCMTPSTQLLATWGARRPQVLLPRHAASWPKARVHVVLSHEMAHVRRQDWVVQMCAEVLRALLWFNPLAWIACARLRRESEQACDDEVLGAGVAARDYAGHLIALARQCRRPVWAPATPMAHPSTLERRIAAMLDSRLDRRRPSPSAILVTTAVLLVIMLPLAAARARQAAPAPLVGTIYDMTGGVVPGVEVTCADANGAQQVRVTDATGRFEFGTVGPGTYVLEASLPGFRKLRQEIELKTTEDWTRTITLQVGELRETVTIRGSRTAATGATPGRRDSEPVRVGGNIRPPLKIKDVKPIYPPAMRDAGLTAVVQLEAVIAASGDVSSVRVLTAQVHPDFAIAAADAVRQWRFTPTLLNGIAVEVVMTVSITFDLEN